jgi:large subunit ribosomal protein L25
MAELSFSARPRSVLGKKVATLRRKGITPANIYGHNVTSTAIECDTHDLGLLLRRAGHTSIITLNLEGEREPRAVLVRKVQRVPTNDQLLHVDFIQVSMREKLRVTIPVTLVGHAPVLDTIDATVVQSLEQVEVECLPGDIPSHLEVSVDGMTDTTSVLHVRDVHTGPDVELLTDPDIVIASVLLARMAEEETEAAAAPEAEEVPTVGTEEQREE